MASTHQSPIMVEQPSSPPHPFATSDFNLPVLSPSTSNQQSTSPNPPPTGTTITMPETQEEEPVVQSHADAETQNGHAQSAVVVEEQNVDAHDGDDSSNSESHSESSTSTETPGTISTPRSSAQDSGQPVPDPSSLQLSTENPEPTSSEPADVIPVQAQDEASTLPTDPPIMPPPPVDVEIPVIDTTPFWVKYEEDTSVPDEDELKEIEADKNELDATNTIAIEKDVFTDLDDPDLRPSKKIRLSWVVKGVRGTKERPNRARIMNSPSVYIDGKYWNIKFFPRGNKSRNSLAAFVRCSPLKLEADQTVFEGSFKCFEGPPDADLSKVEPSIDMKLTPPELPEETSPDKKVVSDESSDKEPQPETSNPTIEDEEDNESVSGDEDDRVREPVKQVLAEDFRVSAQLGIVIYNPDEPRTCYTSSVSHQFYPHQDDWGSDPAVSQYEEIHRRKRGQRQALLRNDTLAIDAYIRVYDDPTQALFWHSSGGEAQWDSKGLAGYFPMGTRLLYHSPATAGIVAYSLLAPFRKALQQVNAGAWRSDSSIRPRPLISHLQLMLFQMRHMKKEELYVHLDSVIHEITRSGESFDNVNMFWETFRRSIEIEAGPDSALVSSFQSLFGTQEFVRRLPYLPVKNVETFQQSADQAFEKAQIKEDLPTFLPLTLQRQSFDVEKRQWQLHNDLVQISEEIDLSRFSTTADAGYTLYGFIVHDGERTSGKFFSVVRPTGPGGKWLVFSDGSGNKVFSYTKKRILEYQGLELPELKKATSPRQTIHTAMYIRTSCLTEYLPKEMESFRLSNWLKPHLDESHHHDVEHFEDEIVKSDTEPVTIEVFWDKIVNGQQGKLDLYKLKSHPNARMEDNRQVFTADGGATMAEVYKMISSQLGIDEKAFKLWAMNYNRLGGVSKGYMFVLRNTSIVENCLGSSEMLTLWLSLVPSKCELEHEILKQNFKSIAGKHVEAPPKPEIETPPSPKISAEEGNDEASTTAIVQTNATDGVEDSQPSAALTLAEETITDGNPQPLPSVASAQSSTTNTALVDSVEITAAADAEQESVREAVEHTLHGSDSGATQPASESTEPGISERTSEPQVSNEIDLPTAPATTQTPVIEQMAASESSTATTTEALVEDNAAPSSDSSSAPESAGGGILIPNADPLLVEEAAHFSNDSGFPLESDTDAIMPAVVHGHLFEASSHEGAVPVGMPIAIGNDQIILISPNQDDISEEDAALITSMIAADIEAAERERRALAGEEALNETDAARNVEIDSRPSTPRQRVADIYGFLHIFDADEQKFTAHSTFSVPADTTISAMVRKQLEYDEERSFHLWKRDGTYRTTGVSLESTFLDASLTDCCEVIVGEHLGEKKMESLKAEAKYVDPGQLMRYIAMAERGHPVLAQTSSEAVEIAEFGGDFYKGPLVRGQRHGSKCSLITQTGDAYEGPLVAGLKSGGTGKMTYQNGDVYDGGWLDDQKHGQGEFVEKRTGNRYVGGYENDKRWGKGTTYWQVADQQAALCQVCYFEEVDALFYKCGHVVACYACAKQCASDSNGCPVCRKPIEAVVKMYRS